MTVGAVINGFTVTGRAYTGGPFDWFTAFNLFCGAGLVVAYALLGSTAGDEKRKRAAGADA